MNVVRYGIPLLTVACLACSDPAALRSGSNAWLRLDLATSAQGTASAVGINVAYRVISGGTRPLFATRVNIETGSRTLSVAIDVGGCLNDPNHLGAPGECVVDLELTLLDPAGVMLDRKKVGPVTLSIGSESRAPPVTLSTTAASTLFEDDFEESNCLAKWTVGGRRVAGTNLANCVTRQGSSVGHLYKTSFTEVFISPAIGPFAISDQPTFTFDMEVWVFSASPPGPTYYASAGVYFSFYNAQGVQLGFVEYIAATTPYRANESARDPVWGHVTVPANAMRSYSLSTAELLSQLQIDQSAISTVEMRYTAYTSAYIPDMRAELWIDNVAVRRGSTGTAIPVSSVTVTPAVPAVAVGGTVQLTATARDANNNILLGRTFTWASSNPAFASVSNAGLVMAHAGGTAAITATKEGAGRQL
ncbi:MAG: Ig-like domain-containing protein [Longimicrobiales bacterium]